MKQGAILRAAFGDTTTPSLYSQNGAALVAEKSANNGTLVIVKNKRDYPFEQLFTEDERVSGFFSNFI